MGKRPKWGVMHGGPLTLEKYHRFFVDPWGTRLTIDQLNLIISTHGFVKLHRYHKKSIMDHVVGHVDLEPPRRSTLHHAAAAVPPSAAAITTAQARTDVDAIGWGECPIDSVAAFADLGDAPEPVEPTPRPADLVLALAVRHARSKRTRSSAYKRHGESNKVKAVKVKEEEGVWCPPPSPPPVSTRSPTPSPPPLLMRSPTPPPPPLSMRSPTSPPPPLSMRSPTSPPPPPPPSLPRPQTVAPSPPPPCRGLPTLAPIPVPPDFGWQASPLTRPPNWGQPTSASHLHPPPGFGTPQGTPPPPQLSWGLPLPLTPPPSGPGEPTFTQHLPRGQTPCWRSHTVPPSYPAPYWGSPSVLPPPQVPWRWPPPPLPHWPPPPILPQHPPHLKGQQTPPPPPPGTC